MVSALLALIGCLERVTGEDVPLDPRFLRDGQDERGGGEPDGGAPGAGAAPSELPYSGYEGERITISGVVRSEMTVPVQLDVAELDADVPGGQRRVGVVQLAGPGDFEFSAPADVAALALQAFQDPDSDGPTDPDPFAAATVRIDGKTPEKVELVLVAGARGQPGGGGGGGGGGGDGGGGGGDGGGGGGGGGGGVQGPPAGTGQPSAPPDGLSFPAGATVELTVRVVGTPKGTMILDFFKTDPTARGGRNFLGRRTVVGPEVVLAFPEGFGAIEIEGYDDLTGDQRSADDPVVRYDRGAIVIGEGPPPVVELRLP